MRVEIRTGPFEPFAEIRQYQGSMGETGKYGATASFIGTMRDFNDDKEVLKMTLEYYPGMTEKHISDICEQAGRQWKILDCLVLHRVGEVEVGQAIVLIAVWSAHRGDALDACRFIIEDLKARAPFWKKEKLAEGERWVEKNTSGYAG